MVQPHIDGALVGGASLKAEEFMAIVRIAAEVKKVCTLAGMPLARDSKPPGCEGRRGPPRPLMERFKRFGDPYILVCLALGVFLAHPLLAPGLPNTADGMLHLVRSVLWRWAWDEGVGWPRWHTLLYQGYGYPLFNFYAPLLYATTALGSYLLPSILAAFKVVLLLACVGYAWGMYLWSRDLLGPQGAVVAAAAYTFAPFRFFELYFEGNYAQFLAWSLYPWVFYFFHRLAAKRARGAFAGAAFSLAALLLTHNISAMLFAPALAAYLLWLAFAYRAQHAWRYMGAAALCSLGLGAVFWLPALAEAGFTQVQVLTRGFFDVAEHFLDGQEMLAPSLPLDYRATNPPFPFHFGRLHLALAAAGALALFRKDLQPRERGHFAVAAFGCAVASLMMLPVSLPLWRAVPGLAFAEYPSRLYGVAFLFSSWLVGASVLWLSGVPPARFAASALACLGLIVAVGVYQFPRPFLPVSLAPADLVEHDRAHPGTTSASEYLSRWVEAPPKAPAISADLVRVSVVDPPPGVESTVGTATSQGLQLQVQAGGPAEIAVAQFYFPGWRAWLDGQSVPAKPCQESGLICVEVPAGEHELRLEFGDTPVRWLAGRLALASLACTLAVTWKMPRASPKAVAEGRPWREATVLATLVLGLLALKVGWVEPHTSLFRVYSPYGVALPATHKTALAVGDRVKLLGYDLDREVVRQGEELRVRLYWQALGPLEIDYSSFVQLVAGPEPRAFAGSDALHPGYVPTHSWHPALYVVDDHRIAIPPDVPPVAFQVWVGLYDPRSRERIGEVTLPQRVHVLPARPLTRTDIPHRLTARFGRAIQLLGFDASFEGEELLLTLYWQADEPVGADFQVFVHGVAADGQVVMGADGTPLNGLYPTSAWWPGQVIVDARRIQVPVGAPPATLRIGLYDLMTLQRLPAYREDGSEWPDHAVEIDLKPDR